MNQDKQFGGNQDKLSGGNLTDYAKKRMAHYAVMFAKSSDEELRQTMEKERLRGKVLGMFFCFIVFCIFAL